MSKTSVPLLCGLTVDVAAFSSEVSMIIIEKM